MTDLPCPWFCCISLLWSCIAPPTRLDLTSDTLSSCEYLMDLRCLLASCQPTDCRSSKICYLISKVLLGYSVDKWIGHSNVIRMGCSNVIRIGCSNVTRIGCSNVTRIGCSNVIRIGYSNVIRIGYPVDRWKLVFINFFWVGHIPLVVKLIKIIKSNGKSQIL